MLGFCLVLDDIPLVDVCLCLSALRSHCWIGDVADGTRWQRPLCHSSMLLGAEIRPSRLVLCRGRMDEREENGSKEERQSQLSETRPALHPAAGFFWPCGFPPACANTPQVGLWLALADPPVWPDLACCRRSRQIRRPGFGRFRDAIPSSFEPPYGQCLIWRRLDQGHPIPLAGPTRIPARRRRHEANLDAIGV